MGNEKKETLKEKDEGGRSGRRSREDSRGSSSSNDSGERERRRKKSSGKHKRRRSRSPSADRLGGSESESEYSSSPENSPSGSSEEELESEAEMRRRRKKRRKEREHEKERERRRKEKERDKKRRTKKGREEKEKKKRKKKKEKEKGKMGAVTNSWGKYGIIRETDMWNKRPEFTAWLAEIKQVNLESLPNWEEKQMFKEFMEDHNTATFPSKKYYDLDAYHQRMILKERRKGSRKLLQAERTVFNDEEQRRQELLRERERQKEEQVKALKYSMQSGMAQAMKEQAQLREEMNYQYRLGNFEAAAAIQRRLDPDLPM